MNASTVGGSSNNNNNNNNNGNNNNTNNNSDLRKEIMKIQQDSTLSSSEKAQKIQRLMSGKHSPAPSSPLPEGSGSRTLSESELAPTYNNAELNVLGCKHYQRGCKMKAACCGKLFTCRLCHDEEVSAPSSESSSSSIILSEGHKIDRYATKQILCMHCKVLQPVSNLCINDNCKKNFGRYFCAVCKFWDNDPNKSIYHCEFCGLCRIGKGLGIDFQHCKKCDACLSMASFDTHKCVENKLKGNCPICHDEMFTSVLPVSILDCSHAIHTSCLTDYLKTNFKCPLCNKTIGRFSWRRMDRAINDTPMPPEYRNVLVTVHCNDCYQDSILKYHVLGFKCKKCGSYNTTKEKVHAKFHPNGNIDPDPDVVEDPDQFAQEEDGSDVEGEIVPIQEGEEGEEGEGHEDFEDEDFDIGDDEELNNEHNEQNIEQNNQQNNEGNERENTDIPEPDVD